MFKGILIEKDDSGYRANLRELDEAQLPEGDVTIRVAYSTLNYKDGLAITGRGPVVRRFPMVPGVDLAGTVERSTSPDYAAGDKVVLNGWGVSETHWGGLAQKARLKGEWLVPLPAAFSPRQAMAIGTAGYTAMLCVMALEKHGVTAKIVRLDGAVESAVRLGVADAVADVVETGTTLRRQGLEIFGPVILKSSAVLIARDAEDALPAASAHELSGFVDRDLFVGPLPVEDVREIHVTIDDPRPQPVEGAHIHVYEVVVR